MTPEEIVGMLSRMTEPSHSFDPDDSAATLRRLIREARVALSPSYRLREARIYGRENRDFSRAMLLVQDAPAEELRRFTRFVVDLLWGEGEVTNRRGARRLEFDKEWESPEYLSEIAEAISQTSFYPFAKSAPEHPRSGEA